MNIRIVVAAHKPCSMPEDPVYVPVRVGKKDGGTAWQRDDEGENIAEKNPWYCELTALYWAWKNLDADAAGLAHYRRYFSARRPAPLEQGLALCGLWAPCREDALSGEEALRLLERAPVVVPPARNYVIESVGSQFAHAHGTRELALLRAVIAQRSPRCLQAWDTLLAGRRAHLCNMFLMRREYFDAYCAWLFDLLFALEERLEERPKARIFGFLGERLLDAWLGAARVPFIQTPVIFLERRNWLRKGCAFLARKFRGTLGRDAFYPH